MCVFNILAEGHHNTVNVLDAHDFIVDSLSCSVQLLHKLSIRSIDGPKKLLKVQILFVYFSWTRL